VNSPRSWLRWLLAITATCGAGVSLFLQSAGMYGQAGAAFARACGAGPRFDCASVLSSQWGQLGPLPTATWGFIYFAFVALWLGIAGLPNRAGRARHLPLVLLVIAGSAASLFYTWIMLTALPAMCPWCLVAHGLNAILLIGLLVTWPRGPAEARPAGVAPDPPRPSAARLAVVAALSMSWGLASIASAAAWYYYVAAGTARGAWLDATNNVDYVSWQVESGRRFDLPVASDDFIVGAENAPHLLVAFLDFECPHCREFEAGLAALLRRHPDRLRVALKHYPMSQACSNRLPPSHDRHRFACDAARAAVAAQRIGTREQAWKYRQLLYANVAEFARRPFVALAMTVGLDPQRFGGALADPHVASQIANDVSLARSLEVDGAGALFLDGRRLPTWRITTTDPQPRMNEVETWRLWDRLLRARPIAGTAPTAE